MAAPKTSPALRMGGGPAKPLSCWSIRLPGTWSRLAKPWPGTQLRSHGRSQAQGRDRRGTLPRDLLIDERQAPHVGAPGLHRHVALAHRIARALVCHRWGAHHHHGGSGCLPQSLTPMSLLSTSRRGTVPSLLRPWARRSAPGRGRVRGHLDPDTQARCSMPGFAPIAGLQTRELGLGGPRSPTCTQSRAMHHRSVYPSRCAASPHQKRPMAPRSTLLPGERNGRTKGSCTRPGTESGDREVSIPKWHRTVRGVDGRHLSLVSAAALNRDEAARPSIDPRGGVTPWSLPASTTLRQTNRDAVQPRVTPSMRTKALRGVRTSSRVFEKPMDA